MSHIPWGRTICHLPSLDRAQATEGGARAPKHALGYVPDGAPGGGGPRRVLVLFLLSLWDVCEARHCIPHTSDLPETMGWKPEEAAPPAFPPAGPRTCPARRSGALTDPHCPPSGHVHPDPEAFFSPLPIAMGCSVCSPSASVENRVAVSRGPWGNLSISRTNDLGYGWFSQAF